jgi:hypothetical protein
MSSIKENLEESLEKIRITAKRESNTLLTESDVTELFNVLKHEDFELKPILNIVEKSFIKLLKSEKYLFLEESIIELLKYYKLIDHVDLINIRHKLFFSDEKKLVKQMYFTENEHKKIKQKIDHIIKKI